MFDEDFELPKLKNESDNDSNANVTSFFDQEYIKPEDSNESVFDVPQEEDVELPRLVTKVEEPEYFHPEIINPTFEEPQVIEPEFSAPHIEEAPIYPVENIFDAPAEVTEEIIPVENNYSDLPNIFDVPATEEQIVEEPIIEEPIVQEFELDTNNQAFEEVSMEESIIPYQEPQSIEFTPPVEDIFNMQPEPVIPSIEPEEPVIDFITTPADETVVYHTPETQIFFQVDNQEEPPVQNTVEDYAGEWLEPEERKRDPIIVFSASLIIVSIILAAGFFFITQGEGTPFAKRTTTTTTTKPANNQPTWPIHGTYTEAENSVCSDKAVELILKQDKTFTFNDLSYTEGEECTSFNSTGTYEVENETITLTTTNNILISGIRRDLQSHAEILITGVNNTEMTLYRVAHE